MGLFFTGKGDKGKSTLTKTKKIDKLSAEIRAVGAVDELNSFIGLAKNYTNKETKKILENTQENLFIIQANIGTLMMGNKFAPPVFKEEKITKIEKIIDNLEAKINPEKKFIISGTTNESAWLDYSRAIARRTEIQIVKLIKNNKKLNPFILAYINRLSSLLYALARYSSKKAKKKEKNPSYR